MKIKADPTSTQEAKFVTPKLGYSEERIYTKGQEIAVEMVLNT